MHSRSAWLEALATHAQERPAAIAIAEVSIDGELSRSISWQEFLASAESQARLMLDRLPAGSTVLAAWPSGIELAALFAGSILAGMRLVLMHPRSGAGEFAKTCEKTNVQAALAADQLLTSLERWIMRIPQSVQAQVGETKPVQAVPGSIVLGSSGTTGLPKLVVRESPALDADARAVAGGMALTPDDRVLCVAPLCLSYGVDILLGTLFAGATLLVMPEFDPAGAARQLVNGVTVLPGLPFVFESLSRFGKVADGALPVHNVRLALSAGSPLISRVRNEFAAAWNIEIGQLYGATELGTVSMSIPGTPGTDVASIGTPAAGVSFRVVDPRDAAHILAAGEEGELAVRAPSMLSEYVGEELALVDGHLLTGDLARIDSCGRATITGRLKLLIDTGGFKVNPLEVEATLLEHPEVAQCAVVPLALSDTIQRLTALIVPRDRGNPPGDSQLRQFVRERLATIKIPRKFEIVESLPRSPLGKLLRDQIPKRDV